jgi:hypothetical protein
MGVLLYDPFEDKVQCHICGAWRRGLNTHVRQAHHYTTDDYREEFGLNKNQSLICEGTRQKLSAANKELGLWKHLYSQTMTKEEFEGFLKSIKVSHWKARTQALILKSERLRKNNPMNSPESKQRMVAAMRKTWYGSQRLKEICKSNHRKGMITIRKRNLRQKKWKCSCGDLFPIREDFRTHKKLAHQL